MVDVERAFANEGVERAVLASIEAEVLLLLGTSATLIPIGDSFHEASSTTFKTVGDEQVTFTYSKAPSSFDTPPGKLGIIPVVTFDGVDEEADTPDAAFWTDAGPITLFVVFKLNTIINNVILAKWDETTGSEKREWQLYIDSAGDLSFQIYDETNNAGVGRKISTALAVDTWYVVVATFTGGADAANIAIWLNGVASDDADVVDDAGFANMVDTSTVVSLGHKTGTSGNIQNLFDGVMAGGPFGPAFLSIDLNAAPNNIRRLSDLVRRTLGL